jgi:hypothetical protein
MIVDLAIHLFDLPEVALQDYDLTGGGIREFAADQAGYLGRVADRVDKLLADGWAVKIAHSHLEAQHPHVTSYAEAVERLRRLHIEEEAVTDIAAWSDAGERLTPP